MEHPILFSGPMVRAILDGRKTQTRRVVKPRPPRDFPIAIYDTNGFCCWSEDGTEDGGTWPTDDPLRCPYGQPGDRLWVRETWASCSDIDGKTEPERARHYTMYRADEKGDPRDPMNYHDFGKWRPSIHMPRWASRITIEIVSVRVERVQEISDEDAIAEGITVIGRPELNSLSVGKFIQGYKCLWNDINAKRGYGWDKNPWVWVIKFKRV